MENFQSKTTTIRMTSQPKTHQDPNSKTLHDLSALILNLIRSPPPPFSDGQRMVAPPMQQITPAGFASLLLGVSLALMLCGSVTFFIGFMLMPWVLGLLVFLYFVGIVSSVSMIGRALLCCCISSPAKQHVPSWKLL